MIDSTKAVELMDEVYYIIRDYPVAYNARKKVQDIVAKQMAEKHVVSVLSSKELLIDGAVISIYRRGRDSIYEVRCSS